jgi:UDP-N-acetylglucosamine--N-acetylmuramyl-(pentapeptide) pyrophosphoryl-undecaprenol N-acetylglucosamine transferase
MLDNKRIIFSGGVTLGSVTPLLAVADYLKKHTRTKTERLHIIWIGSHNGPERQLVEQNGIKYFPFRCAKLRRYFSFKNLLDTVNFGLAILQSFIFLWKTKPHLLVSAGSSISVPLHFAAYILKIPTLIHQQDLKPGLANKLMSKTATRITVACKESIKFFNKNKTQLIGNPVRASIFANRAQAIQKFKLEKDVPTILVMGGGTGALQINNLIENTLGQLTTFCQILHLTGENKEGNLKNQPRYHVVNFLEDIGAAYAAADLVVSRAGFATLTELSALAKPAILIPIQNSHQQDNALYFENRGAAVVINYTGSKIQFVELVQNVLKNKQTLDELSNNIKNVLPANAAENMADIIKQLLHLNFRPVP